ncbi:hypothetical protein CBER1_09680 [Cercospora berteroae]|uniref:Carrier domain-containing protein n=1 Tax=Cercospora berteroae TaxID=357750 RepID=A0A2S6BWB4_9PEZI|nr:hypothetical protein CBER1_09680 [Cercospora berteroae]
MTGPPKIQLAENRQETVRPSNPSTSEAHGAPLPRPVLGLRKLLAYTAEQYARRPALICMHQPSDIVSIDFPEKYSLRPQDTSSAQHLRWSHGQLQYAARLLASGLRDQGLRAGQPIATYLPNGMEWAVTFRAASILRCPFVPLNPRGVTNVTEVEHMLKTSGAKAIVAGDADIATKLVSAVPDIISAMSVRAVPQQKSDTAPQSWINFYELFKSGKDAEDWDEDRPHDSPMDSPVQSEDDEVAVIVFTSGTTSLAKGGIHTNASVGNSLVSQAMALRLTPAHRTCCHMPNHHIAGINISLGFMIVGGCTVFPSASFDPAASLRAIDQERCTNLPSVPAILQAIAAHPSALSTDTSSLRNIELGATTILLEHIRLCWTGLRCRSMSNSYAATEAVPITTAFFDTRTAEEVSVGSVVNGTRVRICAPDTRQPVPRGEAGEMHISGSHLIQGYLGGLSAKSFYDDEHGRWFMTGDQGIMANDGTVTISGRYKDLIIRGGENIAPAAIEAVLDAKLKIQAQVVGVRSEEAGEVPVAVIQQQNDNASPTAEIRKVLIAALGPAFVPENFYTLQDLGLKDYPRTSSGKVRKVELKEIVQKHEDSLTEEEPAAKTSGVTVDDLIKIWRKLLGVDVSPESSVGDFADSITSMRFRNMVKRNLGVDITIEEIIEAGTIQKQAELLSSRSNTKSLPPGLDVKREGPPDTDDVAITLGEPAVMAQIKQQVAEAISPLGFSWDEDVEDILPSWDLGYEVFGNVAGTAKVNHRMAITTKQADVDELYAALRVAIDHHAMQRSFELKGTNGEPTMRVIMRSNDKWFRYAVGNIEAVDQPQDLVKLLYDGVHFREVDHPYPSFLVKVAKVNSTGKSGLIWALQHSAFDGLALSSFLEDLDALLASPSTPLRAHVPYKAWADTYYLHRTSPAATRAVNRQIQRLSNLTSQTPSLFPQLPSDYGPHATAAHRKTYFAPKVCVKLPYLSSLRSQHSIPPFILIKAALALFLASKTNTSTAIFSQNENGRTWPFLEPWMQTSLPDCMDLAGPTLERTLQIIPIPTKSSSSNQPTTVLQFLKYLKAKQDSEAPDVHAPWNLIRSGLAQKISPSAQDLFDLASMSTCLNYLPVRTKDGELLYEAMEYHQTKANCETAWLYNCWIEGDGKDMRLWTQILADEEVVTREQAREWAKEVMEWAEWLQDEGNWEREVGERGR